MGTKLQIKKSISINTVLFRLVALFTMSNLVASQTTFVVSKIADNDNEDCGGTGGQRIYDQKPAVEFLGDGLRMTQEAGYEKRRLRGTAKNK